MSLGRLLSTGMVITLGQTTTENNRYPYAKNNPLFTHTVYIVGTILLCHNLDHQKSIRNHLPCSCRQLDGCLFPSPLQKILT